MTSTIQPNPKDASARTRANIIRRKLKGEGAPAVPDEIAWLADYENAQKSKDVGASRARSRKLTHIEEENDAEAYGTGAAAEAAAAAASSREEGRRFDYLLTIGVDALKSACTLHEKMAAALLQTTTKNLEAQTGMLEAVRTHFLARVEAEGEAARQLTQRELEAAAQGEGDELIKMLEPFLPLIMKRLGVQK